MGRSDARTRPAARRRQGAGARPVNRARPLHATIGPRRGANRIGYQHFSLSQLKVIQEVITMLVFAGFCVVYMKQRLSLDYVWATLCLIGAAYFMFRNVQPAQ